MSRDANLARSAVIAPRLRIVSRSTLATRAAGNAVPELRLHAFGPEPHQLDVRPGAVRALLRRGDRVVAIVAARAVGAAVNGQRDAAVRAIERRAALAAEHGAREPPAVEQHDRLLAAFQAIAQRLAKRAAQHDVRPFARELLAHVHDPHVRERPIEHAPVQRHERVAPVPGVLVALHRGRCRSQHRQRPGLPRAHHRHVAPVIPRALLLLVGPVVFFVHDHEAKRSNGREHCRPRADDDVDVSAADAMPLVVALAVGKAAVLDRHASAERALERGGDRRRQRDFRHEQRARLALSTGRRPRA